MRICTWRYLVSKMNVFKEECARIFGKKSVIILSLFIIIANISINYLNEQQRFKDSDGYEMFSTSSYRDLKGLLQEKQDPFSYIEEQNEKLQAYMNLSLYGSIAPDNPEDFAGIDEESLVKQYEDGELIVFTDNIISESDLFSFVYEEMNKINSYDQYLDDIRQRALTMSAVSLFSDENSFYYKNIQKTSVDYKLLKGIEPTWDESVGVKMATQFPDILLLIGIFSICFILITDEKPMFSLLRSTYRGRASLIRAKIGVSLLYIFALHTFMTITLSMFAHWYYGFGDLSRPIQSVFISAPLSMSVFSYLIWTYSVKMLIFAVFTVIFMFLCVRFKSAISAFVAITGILAASAILYLVITPYSYLNYLKYINLYFLLQPAQLLISYINLNIISYPYSLLPIAIIICIVVFIIGYFLTIHSFAHKYENSNKFMLFKKIKVKTPRFRTIRLFATEVWRLLITNRVLFMLLLFILFQCWKTDTFKIKIYPEEVAYRNTLEIAQQQEDPYTWALAESELRIDNGAKQMDIDAVNRLIERLDYLAEMEERTGKEAELVYESGYDRLIDNPQNDLLNALIMVVGLIICILPIRERILHKLFHTMPLGRGYQVIRKLVLATITTAVVFLLTYLPDVWQVIQAYGLPDSSAAAFSLSVLEDIQLLSIREYLITIYLTRLLIAWLVAMVIYVLSSKGITMAMIYTSILFIVPLMLSFLSITIIDYYPFNILMKTNPLHKMSDIICICLPIALLFLFLLTVIYQTRRSNGSRS